MVGCRRDGVPLTRREIVEGGVILALLALAAGAALVAGGRRGLRRARRALAARHRH